MKETIELGSVPYDENCSQVGDPDYWEQIKLETRAYINQLKRLYRNFHGKDLPEDCKLYLKAFDHDFGTYHEVVVSYDMPFDYTGFKDQHPAVDAAYWLEANLPANWDEEAKLEMLNS